LVTNDLQVILEENTSSCTSNINPELTYSFLASYNILKPFGQAWENSTQCCAKYWIENVDEIDPWTKFSIG